MKRFEKFWAKDKSGRHSGANQIMDQFRDRMKPLYYDPTKYGTYLEQLGIKYPTLSK